MQPVKDSEHYFACVTNALPLINFSMLVGIKKDFFSRKKNSKGTVYLLSNTLVMKLCSLANRVEADSSKLSLNDRKVFQFFIIIPQEHDALVVDGSSKIQKLLNYVHTRFRVDPFISSKLSTF